MANDQEAMNEEMSRRRQKDDELKSLVTRKVDYVVCNVVTIFFYLFVYNYPYLR